MAGTPGYGQGGQPNLQPSRSWPAYGSEDFRDMPDDWVGGARGPAALPSRSTPPNLGDYPAPSNPARGVGASGCNSNHRGAFIEDAGAPRLVYDNELGHNAIPWTRPFYPNIAGHNGYIPPTQMPSWTANGDVVPSGPRVPIPVQRKRIANFTVREEFGSTREFYNNGSLAAWVASIQQGGRVQGRRWMSQAKTKNPILTNLAKYATAGSYGQTTDVLATGPSNVPAQSNPYGTY